MTSPPDVMGPRGLVTSLPKFSVRALQWSAWMTLAVCGLVLFVIGTFAIRYSDWFADFGDDLLAWIDRPSIGGGVRAPTRLAIGIPLAIAVALQGWLAARLLLRGSTLIRERALIAGLATTIAVSILGFAGTLCVAVGRLGRLELFLVLFVTGIALVWLWTRNPGSAVRDDNVIQTRPPERRGLRLLATITGVVGSLVVGFSLLHAIFSPVVEWDATIYHAETARMWFQERPDPPLLYGPSIGVEISSNYPPLFPAAGAAVYTMIGAFDDLYLRVLPPILLAALLLMVFGFARRRFGLLTACLAVLLICASPMTLAYGSWTTSYALLAALIFATVALVDRALESQTIGPWIGAGVVAGVGILTHFYGVLTLLPGIAALATRRPRPWRAVAVFGGAALMTASPWLLRNLVLLGDPLYPIGSPLFDGKGLVEPLWSASQEGIKHKALGYWWGAEGFGLRLRQLATSLFDRQLLVTGAYFGLWFGIVRWRRLPRVAYLATFLGGVIAALLLPGWYWLRALIPVVAVGALLTASLLASLFEAWSTERAGHHRLALAARLAAITTVVVTVAVTTAVGITLAIAGPNHRAMVAGPSGDLIGSVRNWGAPRDQLWTAFSGDLLLWEWLNQHLRDGERFATLEIRTYYLEDPSAAFYLDGIEAVPLLNLTGGDELESYLRQRGIRYVVIPSWAMRDPTGEAISGIIPLFRLLGGPRFPAVAAFAVGGSEQPSVIFSVGRTDASIHLGLSAAKYGGAPSLGQMNAVFPDGDPGSRIFVPTPRAQAAVLRFQYRSASESDFHLGLLSQVGSQGLRFVTVRSPSPGWKTVVVPLPARPDPILDIAVSPGDADLAIRRAALLPSRRPIVRAIRSRTIEDATEYRLPRQTGGRIYVPVHGRAVSVQFQYFDRGRGRLEVMMRRPDASWIDLEDYPLVGSRRWIDAQIQLRPPRWRGFAEVWIRPIRTDTWIRGIRSGEARG